jgi:hypothetical protein
MKGFLGALALFLLIFSCKESSVHIAKPSTFVRYINGGNNDQSIGIIETADKGFMILANTSLKVGNSGTFSKIKLVKTDAYGNVIFQKLYKDINATKNQEGGGLVPIVDNSGSETGYLIVGDEIDATGQHKLLMIQTDLNGDTVKTVTYHVNAKGSPAELDVQGIAVAQAKKTSGDFFVIGQIQSYKDDMLFAQINSSTLDTVWTKTYGSGKGVLANRLFLDNLEQSAYWGGTVTRTNANNAENRLVNSKFNSKSTLFDLNYGPLSEDRLGNDICTYGFGYAIVGSLSSAVGSGVYDSIVYTQIGDDGRETPGTGKSFPLKFSQIIPAGNSICSTSDGGLLILGTLALDDKGNDTDYYLIKIDGFGNQQWTKQYGSSKVDVGSRVLQASDGGYIILGTTNLANVQSIFLMKTDAQGNIQ